MSVEITTGSPGVRVPPDAESGPGAVEVTHTLETAQAVLSRRCGAAVRLTEPEDLGGSTRSVVLRVRVAEAPFELPRTLVVKHYSAELAKKDSALADAAKRDSAQCDSDSFAPFPSSDPFAHEAASCQLATALPPEKRIGPELIAHDVEQRVLVLEDLGRGSKLTDLLFGEDPRAAERSLLAWARALGRLHTTLAGREADFDALMRRVSSKTWSDPVASDPIAADISQAVTELFGLVEHVLGIPESPALSRRLQQAAQLLTPGKYRSFSPSDICPDNSIVTGNGVRFLDFEWGCVRDIALDAAYFRFPFLTSWCAYAMPDNLAETMLATWRSEVTEVWPDLDDDGILRPRLFDAYLLWVWVSTWWFLPRVGQKDAPIDVHMPSPRRSTALVDRWRRLRDDAAAAGLSDIAGYADALLNALVSRFGAGATELVRYPAFR